MLLQVVIKTAFFAISAFDKQGDRIHRHVNLHNRIAGLRVLAC